nr:variable surface lipoprotein [Mycoplasmopsis bovis]
MKKSKFLLLGSVASLAFNSLVAAKCGETKEKKTKIKIQENKSLQKSGETQSYWQKSKVKHKQQK